MELETRSGIREQGQVITTHSLREVHVDAKDSNILGTGPLGQSFENRGKGGAGTEEVFSIAIVKIEREGVSRMTTELRDHLLNRGGR